MMNPDENQLATCLLKINLEEIENEFVDQISILPALDAEHEEKVRETLNILRVVRSLGTEAEQLNQENVRLAAKRVQLKRQSDELQKKLQRAHDARAEMENALNKQEIEIDAQIRKYEDSLRAKADRFRETRGFYNEAEMTKKIEEIEHILANLEADLQDKQAVVDSLKLQLKRLQPELPEDLLDIVGKKELDEKVHSVTAEYEVLKAKQDELK